MGKNIDIKFSRECSTCDPKDKRVVIAGQLEYLKALTFDDVKGKFGGRITEEIFKVSVKILSPTMSQASCCSLWLNQAYVGALPSFASRHDSPCRPHTLTSLLNSTMTTGQEGCVMIVCERSHMFALGCSVARSFPLFYGKSAPCKRATVTVEFCFKGENTEPLTEAEIACLTAAADGIRLTARIVDTPCNTMHTDAFLEEIAKVGNELGIQSLVIRGEELKKRGFGGIYGVGKAAVHPPALAILSHMPQGVEAGAVNIAWVGKGIVYDTGGLSIKGKTAMPGMKRDCGGAAAILGAFKATVKQGFDKNLHAVFCLAENAVGPLATRPDDIHQFYSGKTVEINNTDAEGRLVLGDGVAYAAKDLKADFVVDMATLTGAQGVATGKYHAAIITNSEEWEKASVSAGKSSGDLVHPLPYAPELHFSEFASSMADMKNSVKNRDNAQSSCAGLFIGAHLGFDFPGVWMHFDIAAPVESGERATGYGVALLMNLFGDSSNNQLLKSIAPKVER